MKSKPCSHNLESNHRGNSQQFCKMVAIIFDYDRYKRLPSLLKVFFSGSFVAVLSHVTLYVHMLFLTKG